MRHVWATLLLIGLMLASGWAAVPVQGAAQQADHTLEFFTPVRGTLNDAAPTAEWTFEGRTDEVVSLLVVTVRGDLDPVLQLIAPNGTQAAENDDLDSLVRDAGLEALKLSADGTYTVRILRYQGKAGTPATNGDYELTLTPGFAKVALRAAFADGDTPWKTSGGDPAPPAQGKLPMQVLSPGAALLAFPSDAPTFDELYLQAGAEVADTSLYAEAGLVFRASGPGLARSYQFKVNTKGQWCVLVEDDSGVFALRTWAASPASNPIPDPALNHAGQPGGRWTLGVVVRTGEFSVYANGMLLGTVSDSRLSVPGTVGLLAGSGPDQTDLPIVLFSDVIVTTRLGTTYHGLPLALAAWESSDPGAIAGELAASGQVVLAPARDLFLPQKSVTVTGVTSAFETIGSDQALYSDFVLGADLNIVTEGKSVGCGLFYRWQDERNLDLAYIDTSGGFGVVESRDSQLTKDVYAMSSMVKPGYNKLLVVARGDHLALYVNGALVTEETIQTGKGRTGVAVLNYEDVRTDCFWSNIWVWPLE